MYRKVQIGPLRALGALSYSTSLPRRASSTVAARKPLTSILIANRGEIALRVGRTAAQHGVRTTTIYTEPDALAQHALSSPYALNIGGTAAYLDGDKIIETARQNGCDSIHPGYGFLSENSEFAQKCVDAGLVFIGPPSSAIEAMGNKSRSKDIMIAAGVPCIPGYHGSNQEPAFLKAEAEKMGFPVLVKAVKGGGGKGMRIAQTPEVFMDQLQSAKSEAKSSFGDDTMLVEKYITTPRHIEVQVFADKFGNCVALGERDCSVQRRHQKILEESPAPNLDDTIRKDLWAKARAAALAVNYEGAGTVEFIFDNDTGEFFFMEMNTRLQVEHPATEMVTGQDLVQWQLIAAEGGKLPLTQEEVEEEISRRGHAIEARIYAENPDMDFVPDSGKLTHLSLPPLDEDVRVDAGFVQDDTVSSFYDPMIAKLIVRGENRTEALQKLHAALEQYQIAGPITNIEFIKRLCVHPAFVAGDVETGFIPKHKNELFHKKEIPSSVFTQAALACLMQQEAGQQHKNGPVDMGFASARQQRRFHFHIASEASSKNATETVVEVSQTGPGKYSVRVNGDSSSEDVTATWHPVTSTLSSWSPNRRLDAQVIFDTSNSSSSSNNMITVFQLGTQYRLALRTPKYVEQALGVKDLTHSVLAPMPCKVLQIADGVSEGAAVAKDQPLVVIESMKMETVIRSPQDGVVRKVVHRAGDICKAGTALIEFEDGGGETEGQ